jgi:hypothetical protein
VHPCSCLQTQLTGDVLRMFGHERPPL